MKTVLMSWSGGKDSTMALYETLATRHYRVAALLTSVTEGYERISIHGVRRELLTQQAASLELPLREVLIPQNCSNANYEAAMTSALIEFRDNQAVDEVVFGDLFLEDIRAYREQLLARVKMRGLYPVWGRDTTRFIKEFIALGFKAVVVCVNAQVLGESFAGKMIDEDFLESLPPHVDPCGENGEFHSFVYDGPIFKQALGFQTGATVLRDGHYYCDLIPN